MSQIDDLLHGSIDMHVHFGPDALLERRLDALEAARQARDMGMRGLVLKSHDYCTAPTAHLVRQLVPEVAVCGSICLDASTGGLNAGAVEAAARLGAKVVWMPTFYSANSLAKVSAVLNIKPKGSPISIVDGDGRLPPVATEVLELIRDHDLVLATGHISPRETFALMEEAARVGVRKIVITHPLEGWLYEEAFTMEEIGELVRRGAFVELCCYALMPSGRADNPEEMVQAIKTLGAEHCIMSTDFGQVFSPLPAEGMRIFIATMLRRGLSPREVELMVKTNPAHLLGLR